MQALRTVLRLNAASCLGFGLAFAIWPEAIGNFLDGVVPSLLRWIGVVLVINGVHLLLTAWKPRIRRWELGYFVLGDSLWVLASVGFITVIPVIHSPVAVAAVLLVAAMVGTFACLQLRHGWKRGRFPGHE